jgi:polyphosphate glucokinase
MEVLVIDVGGTRVKLRASRAAQTRRFPSGNTLTPENLVDEVKQHAEDWNYDVVALGFPGSVDEKGPTAEPGNLGTGWVGFDFEKALARPVRVVNDAVMQALGAYESGRMLFLGLGTGVGSALITEHVLIPLELGSLPHVRGGTVAGYLGDAARKERGDAAWQTAVAEMMPVLREAFSADYVVLGGGNAKKVDPLPPHTAGEAIATPLKVGFGCGRKWWSRMTGSRRGSGAWCDEIPSAGD